VARDVRAEEIPSISAAALLGGTAASVTKNLRTGLCCRHPRSLPDFAGNFLALSGALPDIGIAG
jgi:hypothetical protein